MDPSSPCQVLQRNDSNGAMRQVNREGGLCGVCSAVVDRTWSGNLMSWPRTDKLKSSHHSLLQRDNLDKNFSRFRSTGAVNHDTKQDIDHRRSESTGSINHDSSASPSSPGPRLVRSGGIRRDWSFEDLRDKKREDDALQIQKTAATKKINPPTTLPNRCRLG